MKKLVLLVCLLLIPLTLVSETQRRFRVFVYADTGGDADIQKILETHLKRELRVFGDVDIVEVEAGGINGDWHYVLAICYLEQERLDSFSLAYAFYERIPRSYFKANRYPERDRPPLYTRQLGVAYSDKARIDACCEWVVGEFEKEVLIPIRALLR